jgi:MiaB/RimO family radical SAM methylthiotransferase
VLAGRPVPAHRPRDRRTLLPISPVARAAAATEVAIPGHAWGPRAPRRRLDDSPVAPLKLASGCDRRCSFCAIPSFRGSFVSRPAADILAEAQWLAGQGVRELVLVSENSTSYGKDLGDLRLLEALLPELAAVPGVVRVRVSYLQPAELRPSLLTALATVPGVAAYFDLSFQHASEPVLRRMRRFGSTARFLDLLAEVRALRPDAGARSNVIVGFPGETRADVATLERFLVEARLDAVGVFGYSDEDGTEAAGYDRKVRRDTIARRVSKLSRLAELLTAQRAEERVGDTVEVLVESPADAAGRGAVEGRAEHQAPEVDGSTTVFGGTALRPGDLVRARVRGTDGVDLLADFVDLISPANRPRERAGAP